jgi:hypothetical protein
LLKGHQLLERLELPEQQQAQLELPEQQQAQLEQQAVAQWQV